MNPKLEDLKQRFQEAILPEPYDGHGKGFISASGSTDCARKLWFLAQGEEELQQPGFDRLPSIRGTVLEGQVYQTLRQTGLTVTKQEMRHFLGIEGGHVTGRQDAFITWDDGTQAVVDIKHMGARRYLDLLAYGLFRGAEHYYGQLQWYMRQTGIPNAIIFALPFDPSAVKQILSVAKTSQERNIYSYKYLWDFAQDYVLKQDTNLYMEWIDFDPTWLDQNEGRLIDILASPTPPGRSYDPAKDWHCDARWCGVRHLCMQAGPCRDGCRHSLCEEEGAQ